MMTKLSKILSFLALTALPLVSLASGEPQPEAAASAGGFPIEFILFGLVLVGVALFHHHTLIVAVTGLVTILAYKLIFTPFDLASHFHHEAMTLVNLFGLLIGFGILASFFERTNVPKLLPNILPDDWKGGALLIVAISILSSFLDNIAAAVIGGTIAMTVYNGKVHIAYIAAIVAASNAGGAGSVVGDTTTTMMWIDGVPATDVTKAFIGSLPAVIILAVFGGIIQQRHQAIQKNAPAASEATSIQWKYMLASFLILVGAIVANVMLDFPAAGVWAAILVCLPFTAVNWRELPESIKGSIFLLCLVFAASVMPVDRLPVASWQSAFALGFVSAVFDNIPLTKLALEQGGYDWGILAFAVGYGGSMIWFGSSAGVAISNIFPEAKSVGRWLKYGWFVTVAYIVGFFIMLGLGGWNP